MSSLELFALLGYFTRQMFHKPGLSKIKFSLEYIVFGARYPPEGEGECSPWPCDVTMTAHFKVMLMKFTFSEQYRRALLPIVALA